MGVDGLEAGGDEAGGELVVGDGDDGEAFGRSEVSSLPPVAADGSAGDVGNALPEDGFVDVGVALEDAEDVLAGEEGENLVCIDDGDGVVRVGLGRFREVGEVGRDDGDVRGDDDGGAGGERGKIGGEPLELGGVDAAFIEVVIGDGDGVENDKVVALVVKGVVGGAEAVGEEFFAVEGVGGGDAAGEVDAEDVVVADGVVDLETEVLLGFAVEVEEGEGALFGDGESVEDVVATVDGEVCLDGAGFLEGEIGAGDSVEFGLEVGVGDEEEGEGLGPFGTGGGGCGKELRGGGGGEGGGGEKGEEVAAVDFGFRGHFQTHAERIMP